MTKNFNWNYKTAHAMGNSRVRDEKTTAWATFTGVPDPLDQPMPRAKRTHELTDAEYAESEASHAR